MGLPVLPCTEHCLNPLSGTFELWAPNLYGYYQDRLGRLYQHFKKTKYRFKENIPGSAFPCATFNFGPNTRTFRHRDSLNCPFGWCAIQALGDFDPTAGGHLILWDLKLLIEFPPGATIFIPSATLEHSNVPVRHGQRRVSFTQYCSGGIFRWVDNDFQTEDELKANNPAMYWHMMGLKQSRWAMGLALLSRVDDLLESVLPSHIDTTVFS